jgi:hypothetical protein
MTSSNIQLESPLRIMGGHNPEHEYVVSSRFPFGSPVIGEWRRTTLQACSSLDVAARPRHEAVQWRTLGGVLG